MNMDYNEAGDINIQLITGRTLESVTNEGQYIVFRCTDGSMFDAYIMGEHEEVIGEPNDLIGKVIASASIEASYAWPTHVLRADDGTVVRWMGMSDGYDSESVYFTRLPKTNKDE